MTAKHVWPKNFACALSDLVFRPILMASVVSLSMFFSVNSFAETSSQPGTSAKTLSSPSGSSGTVGGSGTVMPDLFTGTMSYSIPIEVPAGRKGMQPNLALTYRSNNGNGWVGVGWDLEVGAIERNARNGIDYAGNEYVLRMDGAAIDLVDIDDDPIDNDPDGNREYRAKIESGFLRIKAYFDVPGIPRYWEVTDKSGTRYLYGQTAATRQDNPTNSNERFKWCLEKVEDTNGNYMTLSYFKNQGQIYLDKIEYTGNGALAPVNYVRFYRESRTDAPDMYSTKFKVKTAYRLKTIAIYSKIVGVDTLSKAYKLEYDIDSATGAQYSASTGRSLLSSFQQFDKTTAVDPNTGTITGGTGLPRVAFSWQVGGSGWTRINSINDFGTGHGFTDGNAFPMVMGDFNGDGITDYGRATNVNTRFYISNGQGVWAPAPNLYDFGLIQGFENDYKFPLITGDFNADGRTDIGRVTNVGMRFYLSDKQSGWKAIQNLNDFGLAQGYENNNFLPIVTGDFNGDGTTDIGRVYNMGMKFYFSDGVGGWISAGTLNDFGRIQGYEDNYLLPIVTGDFNGDGKTDIGRVFNMGMKFYFSDGQGGWKPGGTLNDFGLIHGFENGDKFPIVTGDFNGDGKTDIARATNVNTRFYLSDGQGGWKAIGSLNDFGLVHGFTCYSAFPIFTGDFNGDGKTDIGRTTNVNTRFYLSDGQGGWKATPNLDDFSLRHGFTSASVFPLVLGDFNGDGKTDISRVANLYVGFHKANTPNPDLLATIDNGIGGLTTITYKPSTVYDNTQLPFPLQLIYSITTNDGNGVVSPTTYEFSGGYYHIGDKDFRGFSYVKVTGPAGPNGEQSITETWFHQGNDNDVNFADPTTTVDDPSSDGGYMKGKPYFTRVKDQNGKIHSKTVIKYQSDTDGAPVFNPVAEVRSQVCGENNICGGESRTAYTYDQYGNITREDQYGDVNDGTDDRTIIRTFAYDANSWSNNWPVILPASEAIYEGTYSGTPPDSSKVSFTMMQYDGQTADNCSQPPVQRVPHKSNLTRIRKWFKNSDNVEGPDLEIWKSYDAWGNNVCTRDGRGNIVRTEYDYFKTYITKVINAAPFNHVTETTYYGVNYVPLDDGLHRGLYGQVRSVTDANNGTAYKTYDNFGRESLTTAADGSRSQWSYPIIGYPANPLGVVGSQRIILTTSAGITTEEYFDGFGRTIKTRKTGPAGKYIVVEKEYNATGTVKRESLPYFEGFETTRWIEYKYDAMGRVTEMVRPDPNPSTGTAVTKTCYDGGVTVSISPEKKKRRVEKDVNGRIRRIQEYPDNQYEFCSTEKGADVYAETEYQYDVMGNLTKVIDHEGNETLIWYDSLGRKDHMKDPDMGEWRYTYDENGNLTTQTDAKGQKITFVYDEINRLINRLIRKDLQSPEVTDVMYTYDEPGRGYSKGRLTTMTDASGETRYSYDIMGQVTQETKITDNKSYGYAYSYLNGRLQSIQYPSSNDSIYYQYEAGNLKAIVNDPVNPSLTYIAFSEYNALGQPKYADYGNGVRTEYSYIQQNNRLQGILVKSPQDPQTLLRQNLMSLTYEYYKDGNVKTIRDDIDPTKNQIFTYDGVNRLETAQGAYGAQGHIYDALGNIMNKAGLEYTYDKTSGIRPHAVIATNDGKSYGYDPNGNMTTVTETATGNILQEIDYNVDNMPESVTTGSVTTTFVYDGAGRRVKKTTSNSTTNYATIYIGKMFECNENECVKYIFAGETRIARIEPNGNTVYYHQDHLGSTRIVTGPSGAKDESYDYYPFGTQFGGTPSDGVSHKYTGQEYDADTGLYFYNARYYNPVLGRFISPDTVVPGTFDPQALNRYSYARNNPMMYNDPSGHYWWVVPAILAAYSAYQTYENGGHFNDMLKSAAITFAVSSIGGYVGGYIGNYIGSYTGALVGGAVSGAVTGGLYAAVYHGNIARSMVQGGVSGIIMAGVSVAYNEAVSNSYDQVTQETVAANDSSAPAAVVDSDTGEVCGPSRPGTSGNYVNYNGYEVNLRVMMVTEDLANYSGYDIVATSGMRFDNILSEHYTGNAIDFYMIAPDGTMLDMEYAAYVTAEHGGFSRVGYYSGDGPHRTHIHGDLKDGARLYWTETDRSGYRYNSDSNFWRTYFDW